MKKHIRSLLFGIGLMTALHVNGQGVVELPLSGNQALQSWLAAHPHRAPVCPPHTLSLPFFDDFSYPGPYPDCNRWQDNQVYVNTTYPVNPTSIGVATFDGLNALGQPYDPYDATTISESADTLTSQMINLQGLSTAYLYFQIENQGLGDAPEERDSLMLDFLDMTGNWNHIQAFKTSQFTTSDTFNVYTLTISDPNYLHSGFEFRFHNLATTSGNNDHWHLDYVSVSQNNPNGSFPDVALQFPPRPLLKNYTAMPYHQFKGHALQEIDSLPILQVFNNSGNITFLDSIGYSIREMNTGTSMLSLATNGSFTSSNIDLHSNKDFSLHTIIPYTGAFYQALDNFSVDSINLRTTIGISANLNNDNTTNNSYSSNTVLDNYYAYDDGTAESRIVAQGDGTRVAIKFTANEADSIRGLYVQFPYFLTPIGTSDYIHLKIWKDNLTNTPALSDNFIQPQDFQYETYTDSINGWWTYAYSTPVGINAGETFYIGWEQGSLGEIAIGFDRNNPTARANTFLYTNGAWDTIPSFISGAVMMRPILGSRPVAISSNHLVNTDVHGLNVFPNPATDRLQISGTLADAPEARMEVSNMYGQIVYSGIAIHQLDISAYATGMYILNIRNAGVSATTRFIKTAQ